MSDLEDSIVTYTTVSSLFGDKILPTEEQPLPAADSPTANSPGYILKFDPEEDLTDYPTEEGDITMMMRRRSPSEMRVMMLRRMRMIPSLPLPVATPLPISSLQLHASPSYPLGYRASMIRLRDETPSTSHPLRLSPKYKVDGSSFDAAVRPTGGFRLDYDFVATLDDEIRRDPKREVGYGFTGTWDEMLVGILWASTTDETEMGSRMTNFITTVRQDTDEIYKRLDNAQDDRALINGQVNMLYRDRCDHAWIARMMETEARLSRQSWVQSVNTNDLARSKKMAPKKTTRSTPTTTTTTTVTSVTNGQLKALIDQGVANAFTACDADRSQNGEDSHDSRMGMRRQAPPTRECTYQEFMKCKPLYFNGTKGVVELTKWPKTMQEEVEISTELMDKRNNTSAERQAENKRMFDDTSKNNQNQQQQNKRQNTGMAYTAGSGNKKPYGGSKPLCSKCNYHHDGQGTGIVHKPTCFEYGAQGHFKRECPKLKNNNQVNQARNGNALAKVYAVGHAGTNPDLNIIIELGSFDAIIGMDWLTKYQDVIVCAEKIVRIPWGSETLIVHGDRSDQVNETQLNIISCTKMKKYILEGCHVFLAHVTAKETKDKSEKKRLEEVPIVRDFPKVFR
nr:reverse transcriptase domain-containing protein [Tanacetum cinerariifolium]